MPERTLTRFESDREDWKVKTSTKSHSPLNNKKRKRGTPEPRYRADSSPRSLDTRHQNGIPIKNPDLNPATSYQNSRFPPSKSIPPSQFYGRQNNGNNRPSPSEKPRTNTPNGNHQDNLKARADALWLQRKQLPIWSHVSSIRRALRQKDVLLLVGETGSGKSTQVPQMLLQEKWFQSKTVAKCGKVGGCIAITEPRRVAAINLARRVAEEMGTTLGGAKGKVGYSVRFDSVTGPETKIKFLTEGMLLQEMLRDPFLKQYSAVLVDEVHERGTNVDLVLGFLKRIAVGREGLGERGGVGLKVGVMSATAEVERLIDFFGEEHGEDATIGSTPEKTSTLTNGAHKEHNEASESDWSGFSSSDEDSKGKDDPKHVFGKGNSQVNGSIQTNSEPERTEASLRTSNSTKSNGKGDSQTNGPINGDTSTEPTKAAPGAATHVAACYIEGRQYPVSIHYTPEPVADYQDATLRTIFQIHHSEPMPGDILVFLTGQEVVESLEHLVNNYATGLSPAVPKLLVLPLFAALPQAAQQQVFQSAPKNTRKVILSTNIAETSVTVSGVRFVIDSGKMKTKHYRHQMGLESLLVKPISKSAAIQRKGRAGREAPGKCYRLYTESTYLSLDQDNTPEILRSDLSHAILTMKARGVNDITSFPLLSPPPRESLEKALLLLFELGALSPAGQITSLGHKMARLPLSASLSRALLAACDPQYDCLDEAIDIVAALSVENIFLQPTAEEKREAAESARADLARREGDHLTLLCTVRAYREEGSDRRAWCEKRWVSHRGMRAVWDVRKQLRAHFRVAGDGGEGGRGGAEGDAMVRGNISTEKAERILKAFLMGFKMNTARLMPDGRYRTLSQGNADVGIHPSSTLFGRRVECIMYNEFVFTNKAYARGVSAVQMDWVGEVFSAQGEDDGET